MKTKLNMTLTLLGIFVLFASAAFAEGKGSPRFMAIYMPEASNSMNRDTRMVKFAEQAINGVFTRMGFAVIDRTIVAKIYKDIPQSGGKDEDLAKLALKSKADMLLVYDVNTEKYDGGKHKPYDNILINISLHAVSTDTAESIAQKNCNDYAKIIKSQSDNYANDNMAAKVADKAGKCVASAIMDDVMVAYVNKGFQF